MRSALYGKSDYFARIKRKPAQELLYQKVIAGELSDDEIANCGQPLWVREALAEIKLRGGQTQWDCINAAIAQHDIDREAAALQTYPVYVWKANAETITPPKGFDLEVQPGEFILVDKNRNQVKIDYALLSVEPATIAAIVSKSEYLCDATDPGFIELVGKRKKRG